MRLSWLGQEQDPSELLRRLPPCYSREFDDCVGAYAEGRSGDQLSSFCRQYHELWRTTPAPIWDAAMDSMEICPAQAAPQKSSSRFLLGVLAGSVLGYGLARAAMR